MGKVIGIGNGIGIRKGSKLNLSDEYKAVLTAMTIEPSYYDKYRQNRWLKKMVDGGYYAKADILDMFSVDKSENALINWKNPNVNNPLKDGEPIFQKYAGFGGREAIPQSAINLNYNPANSTKVATNDMTVIIGVGFDRQDDSDDFGGHTSGIATERTTIRSSHTDGNAYFRLNGSSFFSIANTDKIKYYATSINAGDRFYVYLNKTKYEKIASSVNVPNIEMYGPGANEGGTIKYSSNQLRFVFIFTFLTEQEISNIIDITEEYLTDYRTNLIGWDNFLIKSDKSTKESISLTTYDGSGETVHPTVVDIGTEWNGFRYWMANTPYPNLDSAYENPSIWASNDGITWVVPAGLINPVVPAPSTGYNADSDLFYDADSDKLYITYKEAGTKRLLKMCSSSDGVNWSAPVTVITPTTGETELVSPSLIKIDNKYYMYCMVWHEDIANGLVCKRLSCDTIDGTYGNREIIDLPQANERNKGYWHHQITYINGYYWLAATERPHCYIFRSIDGVNFVKSPYPVVFGGDRSVERRGLYKPSITTIGNDLYLYYSHQQSDQKFFISRVKLNII